ncbi:rhomboid family intramembrane serine protease [Priestia megaterium]|nr:rhomboid family intramembrane serine protease [Priestia megaterium]
MLIFQRYEDLKTYTKKYPAVVILTLAIVIVQLSTYFFGVGPTDFETARKFGAIQSNDYSQEEWFRLATYLFVQIGGTMHLLANVACLVTWGPPLERILGSAKFTFVYFATGLVGGLFILIFSNNVIAAGASGSIFGIIGLYVGLIIQRNKIIDSESKSYIWGAFIINIIYTFLVPNVSIAAHLGGLCGGLFLSFILRPKTYQLLRKSNLNDRLFKIIIVTTVWFFVISLPKFLPNYPVLNKIEGKLEAMVFVDINEYIDVFNDKPIMRDLNPKINKSKFIADIDNLISHYSGSTLSLSLEGKEYIQNNIKEFSHQIEESRDFVRTKAIEVDVKKINKDVMPYLTTVTKFNGQVIYIEEFDYGESRVTYAILEDNKIVEDKSEYNYFTVIMFGTADNIYEKDYITFYGLPIGRYASENTLGGQTNSQMFLGSLMEKR